MFWLQHRRIYRLRCQNGFFQRLLACKGCMIVLLGLRMNWKPTLQKKRSERWNNQYRATVVSWNHLRGPFFIVGHPLLMLSLPFLSMFPLHMFLRVNQSLQIQTWQEEALSLRKLAHPVTRLSLRT